MKATKIFKIGEYAVGGIITVQITDDKLAIQAREWVSKKVIMERAFLPTKHFPIWDYLCELTSSYYADKIIEWIETKIKLEYGM